MKSLFWVILLSTNSLLFSQPDISWIKEYDTGSLDEKGISVTETNDNSGYIICAFRTTQETSHDLYLIKTNGAGDTVWTKQYGTKPGSDYGMKILKTGDGYVIGGMLADSSTFYFTAWLLKINEDGDSLWSHTLLDSARIKAICLTPDSGIAATGGDFVNGRNKLFIARFNSEGGLLWLNYYFHENFYDSFGYDIICTQDSSLIILGAASDSTPPNLAEPWLIRTDENGTIELDTVHSISGNSYYFVDGNINQTKDGNFIIAEDLIGSVSYLKINSEGQIADSLIFSNDESSPRILQTADSNYIFMYTTIFGSNNHISIIVKKTDQNFSTIWSKEIQGNNDYFDYGFIITDDNSLLCTGWTQSGQNNNILLVKLVGDIIPVELVSFQGQIRVGRVILNWETATEHNNLGFNVERSEDQINWQNITFVPGYGTALSPHSYTFVDSSRFSGIVYYRLKQIDFDGSFTYSDEIKIEFAPVLFSLSQNYPNPFNPVTRINYSISEKSAVNLVIYNMLGQQVSTVVDEIKLPGHYSIDFNASKLASGVYIYQLTSGKSVLTRKMLLLR